MITFILIGIAAWAFTNILMDGEMIFGWWYKILNKLPEWLAKPLGKCEYCLSGQMAFWFYLYEYWNDYDFFQHILLISLSIFIVELINTLIYGKK